jgi:MoaA/NifB/PqqE/SkfB family radical SAM enzyme
MNPKDYLTNRAFCPMPWTGLMYNFDGKVKNCIRSSGELGNIQDTDIVEILNGATNIDNRSKMLSKQSVSSCSPCYDLEKEKNQLDIISDRVFYLKELKSVNLDTYNSKDNFNLHTIDVRWSNLCNFACVYCNSEFSSKWASELNIRIKTPQEQRIEKFKNYIFDNVTQLKHVYMAGGEPLLMKENLDLLLLLKEKNPAVNLRINTNLSKVDTRIFDLICEFKNVHWTVSVESMNEEYEYIRYGGTWNDFLDNLNIINKLNHKISFNMLHFLLNYRSIFDCIDFLKGLGFHNNSFVIGPLLSPGYLNIRHLPDNVLYSVKEILKERINESPKFLLENSYRNMLQYLELPIDKKLLDSFEQIKIMDQRRNLDSRIIFKDLYSNGH